MALDRTTMETILRTLPPKMTQEDLGQMFFAVLTSFKVPVAHAINTFEAVIEEMEDMARNPEQYPLVPLGRKN
jgi:hypothetical protein